MRQPAAVAATRHAVRAALTELSAGEGVLVAVSGGADSMALAAAAAHASRRQRLRVRAVTVDHGLQEGSAARAQELASTLRGLGLGDPDVVAVRVGSRGGPEAAARVARYAALEQAAARHDARAVLLGHTLDDQAETVLLGLARGSGARSLAGMAPRQGRWVRPFLRLRRATTRAACRALELPVWDDPHNDDQRFARVRVRATALPALEAALGPGVAEALARSADLLRDDADALDALAAAVAEPPGAPLQVAVLLASSRAVRTRVLRAAAVAAGAPPGQLTAAHVSAMVALVENWHGQGPVALPGALVAERRCDSLWIR